MVEATASCGTVEHAPPVGAAPWRWRAAAPGLRRARRCPVDLRPRRWDADDVVWISDDGTRRYPVVDGIPCLFAPNEWPTGRSDVTELVRSFYEESPFPN